MMPFVRKTQQRLNFSATFHNAATGPKAITDHLSSPFFIVSISSYPFQIPFPLGQVTIYLFVCFFVFISKHQNSYSFYSFKAGVTEVASRDNSWLWKHQETSHAFIPLPSTQSFSSHGQQQTNLFIMKVNAPYQCSKLLFFKSLVHQYEKIQNISCSHSLRTGIIFSTFLDRNTTVSSYLQIQGFLS